MPPQTSALPVSDSDAPSPAADTWEGVLAALRRRFPGQKDSVLFCLHKLQQNPDLTLRDFRDEAKLHGIPMAGRALHSARGLLGLSNPAPARRAAAKTRRAEAEAEADADAAKARLRRERRRRAAGADDGPSIEAQVIDAVRQLQSAATRREARLRDALRRAVDVLQQALDETDDA